MLVPAEHRETLEPLAHLKRILRLGRLRFRGPSGARRVHACRHRAEPETACQAYRETAGRSDDVSCVSVVSSK